MRVVSQSASGNPPLIEGGVWNGDVVMTWGLVLSVAAGGTVALLGVLGSSATLTLGALFPGVIALLSGFVLALR
jgi:hypothetical protein